MIGLERHIEILLLHNDCVIVPGLGGFVAHHVSASFDADDGMFLPPLRTLGFNPQLRMNDSMLAQSYVEAYDISYPAALSRIEREVEVLQKQLAERGRYELNDIGILKKNDEGNIEFTPCEAGILTPDFYGLSCFDFPELSKNHNSCNDIKSKEKRENIVYISSSADSGHRTLNIRLSALRNIAVAAAIITFSLIITSPASHNDDWLQSGKVESSMLYEMLAGSNRQKANTQSANTHNTKSTAKPQSPASTKQNSTNKQAAAQKKVQATPKAATKRDTPPYWCIVLCSHVKVANARLFGLQLEKEGIKNSIIEEKNGKAKVIYGNYPTAAAAYSALNKMRSNIRFKQGWVLKIEKN